MTTYYLPQAELQQGGRQRSLPTFVPITTEHLSWIDASDADWDPASLRQPRSAQSPKGLFLPAAESLGRYSPQADATVAVEVQPVVLVGVRACELRARNYLDAVMLEGNFQDPLYRKRRESMTVISCDCVDCTDSCFCTMVGGRPYPTEGFDANLAPIEGGYVLEVVTEAGRNWLGEERLGRLSEATSRQLSQRDALRKGMVERLRQQNRSFGLDTADDRPPTLPDDNHDAWQQFAADCVECGACTHICPTCHCFYLYDQALGPEQFERVRTWDSCLLSTYHRMAGGPGMKLSPRPKLFNRLANRVLHKFTYSPQQYQRLGCVGCGRCVDACIGAIDIRQVVKELSG